MTKLAAGDTGAEVDSPSISTLPPVRALLRRIFSFPVFLGALLVAGTVAVTTWENAPIMAGTLFAEGDMWWHVAVAQRILSTHHLPQTDIFSFTVFNTPWIDYEWLPDLLTALAARWWGLQGLAGLLVLLVVILVLLLYYYAWVQTGQVKAAAVATGFLLPILHPFFTLRPQLLGYIFLIITLICLERFRQGHEAALWILPGVFVLWVNTHGSFVLGFLALALYWAGGLVSFHSGSLEATAWTQKARRRLLLVALLCTLVLPLTPYGTRLAAYPFDFVFQQQPLATALAEMQPLNFSATFGVAFLALVLLLLVGQVISPVKMRLEILALLVFALGETCLHARFLIVFAVAFIPVLAEQLSRWLPLPPYDPATDHPVANAVLVAAIALGILAVFPSRPDLKKALAGNYPVAAMDFLGRHPVPGRLFNEDSWGGFLMWSQGPEHKVFMDSRSDVYLHSGVLEDYAQILLLRPEAFGLLHRYGITACLLHRGIPLGTLLAATDGWRKVYVDDVSEIFARSDQAAQAGPITKNATVRH